VPLVLSPTLESGQPEAIVVEQPILLSTDPSSITARRIEDLFAHGLCQCVVLGTLIRYLGRWHWVCEITTHFVVQATVLAGIASLYLFLRRYRRMALVAGLLGMVNAMEWVPFYTSISLENVAYIEGESLEVVSVNVYPRNRQSDELYRWLKAVQADVVFISEVDPWWADQIESWKADWPHQVIKSRSDNFGLALISRLRISHSLFFNLDGAIPAVECQVESTGGDWTIVGLHPLPPSGAANSRIRDQQLHTAAEYIRTLPPPRVVLGDYNSTSSSPVFQDFIAATGLRDSRYGFGWQPTWPAKSSLLRIPIDHCLVEPGTRVLDRSVGPDIGSDHFPVRAHLVYPP